MQRAAAGPGPDQEERPILRLAQQAPQQQQRLSKAWSLFQAQPLLWHHRPQVVRSPSSSGGLLSGHATAPRLNYAFTLWVKACHMCSNPVGRCHICHICIIGTSKWTVERKEMNMLCGFISMVLEVQAAFMTPTTPGVGGRGRQPFEL